MSQTLTPEQIAELQKQATAARRTGFLTQIKSAGASDDECRRLMGIYDKQYETRENMFKGLMETITGKAA